MKAFGPFVVCQIYLIFNLVHFTVSVLRREDASELPLTSYVNKINRPKWSYNNVPNNLANNQNNNDQENPKMVVELDNGNINGDKDVVTSNELKEVIKILDMLDGLGTRTPTQQIISKNEEQAQTTPPNDVQSKSNTYNKIKSISEKITHSLEYLSRLVGDYSGIVSAQNDTLHGVLKNMDNEVTKLNTQKAKKHISHLSVKLANPKKYESNNVCKKEQLYKAAMDELSLVTNKLKNNIGMVMYNKGLLRSNNNNNNSNHDDSRKSQSKNQAVLELWDDIVKFYDTYQNKINVLVYDLVFKTSTRSDISNSTPDIELCKSSYEAFIKLLYNDVSKLSERIDEFRATMNNEDDVTKAPIQLIDNNLVNSGDPLVNVNLNDGHEFMAGLKKLMDKVNKNIKADKAEKRNSEIIYNQNLKNTLTGEVPPNIYNHQRSLHNTSPDNTLVGSNYVSVRSQCIQLMTHFFKHNLNDANVDDILATIDNTNNPYIQVVCPHSSDYKHFIVKYFLFKMFVDKNPNCKLFFDNPKEMIKSFDTSCYHKGPLPTVNEVTKKPCNKNKLFENDKLPNTKSNEIPQVHELHDIPHFHALHDVPHSHDLHDVPHSHDVPYSHDLHDVPHSHDLHDVAHVHELPEESHENSLPMTGYELPFDLFKENIQTPAIHDKNPEQPIHEPAKVLLPIINVHKHSVPKENIGHFIKYKIPVKLLTGGKCISSQTQPEDIREELKLYFDLLNQIYTSMNRSPTEKESLLNLRTLYTLNRICLSTAKGDIALNYMIKTRDPMKYFIVKLRIPFQDFRESALAELRDSVKVIDDIEDTYKKIITNCNVVSISPELQGISDVITVIKTNGVLVNVILSGVETYTSTAKLDCRTHLIAANNENKHNNILSRQLRSLDKKRQYNSKYKPLIRPANAPLRFNRIW